MAMETADQGEARDRLAMLFQNLGESARSNDRGLLDGMGLGDLGQQLEEFLSMPADLALIFMNMATELAELVLKSLAEAGYTLVKGMTPA